MRTADEFMGEHGEAIDVGHDVDSREFYSLLADWRRRRGGDPDDGRELAIFEYAYKHGADHAAA